MNYRIRTEKNGIVVRTYYGHNNYICKVYKMTNGKDVQGTDKITTEIVNTSMEAIDMHVTMCKQYLLPKENEKMSYSGNAEFDYEIERMKNKLTGELVMYDSVAEDAETHEYVCIKLKVTGRAYYQEGRTSGPPEYCYPDEGEVEMESCIGPDGKDWDNKLSGKEREAILELIDEEVNNGEPDDYEPDYKPDYDDFDY